MVSQKDIAEAIGVSIMTVSRALRNHPDLSAETRQRILAKAAELGYAPLPSSTPVPTGTVRRVGILFCQQDWGADAPGLDHLGDGVPYRIFNSIQSECKKRGVETVIEMARADEIPQLVRRRTVDRAFLFGRYTSKTIESFGAFPILAISNYIYSDRLPRLTADNERGTQLLTEHLIELGHRRIQFLGVDENQVSEIFRSRESGYLHTMIRHGLTPVSRFYQADEPRELVRWLGKATAVVCCSDYLAFLLDDMLRQQGWKLPGQLSLTGFDNIHPLRPGYLTTYEPDCAQMGRLAVRLLIDQCEEIQGRAIHITVPGRLVVQQSTSPVGR